ncbi:hypothetical protein BCR43DRAFT_489992 [Syncephalastrum racemosum]|uniref:N-acetyltransferase domain-containing protein n=1 Tax=Syncephalastrum racemosum TaxID=13706 RepID=A0A1X2HF41_SYNRA|nr:hypothetical protein BCR43DRAFT_489992 [Syncephalastrum racemosum]
MTRIRNYRESDADGVRAIYIGHWRKTERRRTLQRVLTERGRAKTSLQASVVGLLSLRLVRPPTWWSTSWTAALATEVALWSLGLGVALYLWTRSHLRKVTATQSERFTAKLTSCLNAEKSGAWVMEDDKGQIVGAAALQFAENEGRVLTGASASSKIELALVQTAIQFARQNNISVIAKSSTEE